MKDNQHIQAMPQDVLTQAQTEIDEVKILLALCAVALTPAERYDELPKRGEKTIGFVEKAYDFAKRNLNFVPPYLDMVDFGDACGFWTFHNAVFQLKEGIGNTEMAAGSEACQAAFVFCKPVKMAAAQGVPGTKAVYKEPKTRFSNRNYQRRGQSSVRAFGVQNRKNGISNTEFGVNNCNVEDRSSKARVKKPDFAGQNPDIAVANTGGCVHGLNRGKQGIL
jgi:hypothetical protein